MPKSNNTPAIQPTPAEGQYSASDMLDAHSIAESDLQWAVNAIGDISGKFQRLKRNIQSTYSAHDCYFDDLQEFIFMYEYLIESRQKYHKEQAMHFEAEWKVDKAEGKQ